MSLPSVALGDVAEFIRGVTYKPQDLVENFSDGSVVCMRTANVQRELQQSDLLSIPRELVKSENKMLREGDLLVSTANSWNLVGKCCWVPALSYPATAGGFIAVLRGQPEKVDLRYLYHWFSSPDTQADARNCGRQTTNISNMDIGRCLALRIPLPPLAEQRRIAAMLDKADALRAKRREAIAKLGQLLQSVFLDMFGDPATNSKHLPTVSLGDLGEWRSGGTPSRSNSSFFHGEIPWYSSGELNSPYVGSSNECISEGAVAASAAKLMRPGSLMVGMYDTAAFKSSITTIPAACNQAVAFSLLDASKCETVYVYQALQVGKEHFKRLQRGVRQKNLNLSMIRETKIPLPPVEQQRKFARVFAAVLGQHDRQSRHADRVDSLFRAMQRRTFAGTL